MQFTIGTTTLDYFQIKPDPFGLQRTARPVEIALARHVLADTSGLYVLEVGNTLHQYIGGGHLCVDQFDRESRVIQQDVLNFMMFGVFDLVISISTLEHIGWDTTYPGNDRGESWRAVRAVGHCRNLMASGGKMLATWDIGANPSLDDWLEFDEPKAVFDRTHYLAQDAETQQWSEVNYATILDRRRTYGNDRTFSRDLFVGTFNIDL